MNPKQAGDCRFALIRETLINNRSGCGIYEALLPLATLGAFKYLHQEGEVSEIKNERESLALEIKTLEEREVKLYEEEEARIISEEQRHVILAKTLAQRLIIQKRQDQLNKDLENRISNVPLPHEIMSDFWAGKTISGKLIREFFRGIIKSIHVYAYRVEVRLTTGETFSIERIPVRNARLMPLPMVMTYPAKSFDNTKLRLFYQYKSYKKLPQTPSSSKLKVFFENETLEVGSVGENPAPYARTRRNKKKTVKA